MSSPARSLPSPRPGRPILCLVVDRGSTRHALPEAVAQAVAGGVDWVQLRDRELEGGRWLAWAEELASAARSQGTGVRVVVNRRVDVALAIGADGVHLGFDAMTPLDARKLLGPEALVGVSTHELAEIRALETGEVDYVHLAPIYDPLSKTSGRPPLGPEALTAACAAGFPVIAQGGLRADHCAEVLGAGAGGIAVTGAILGDASPGQASARLRSALDQFP
ncbi:MAG: thiamine phosphate synthase [Myxococcota bacterium]|nr:thiamine phosphate synthase [Myxococcota bacterium]